MGRSKVLCLLVLGLMLMGNGLTLAASDILRIHVIANSDSFQDQRIKEQVRDYLLAQLQPQLAGMNRQQAEQFIVANKENIADLVQHALASLDLQQEVTVSYGVTQYPTRLYGAKVYPAGRYRSLRITLGEGKGRNWWCLLFPPLCFVNEVVEQGEGQGKPVVRFWLVEQVKSLLSRWQL